ncbi:hypothetical protein D9M71_560910 [compost metagenome]
MRPGHAGFQVDPGEDVVVVPDRPGAVAPGCRGGKAVVLAVAGQVGGRRTKPRAYDGAPVENGAGAIRQRAGAVDRITPVTRLAGAFQPAHMGDADFTDHGEAAGPHDLVEEVGEGGLELGDFLAPVAVQVLPGCAGQHRGIIEGCPIDRPYPGEQNICGVELHRSIGAVAELAAPGRAGGQRGGEAQAIQADVFRILDEVLGVARNDQGRQPTYRW